MLPERPLNAKPRKVVLVSGAIVSCGCGSIALLFGHAPPNASLFLALACVFAANAGIVFYAWPTTDGFLIQDRGSRKGRKGGPSGLGPAAAAGCTAANVAGLIFSHDAQQSLRADSPHTLRPQAPPSIGCCRSHLL